MFGLANFGFGSGAVRVEFGSVRFGLIEFGSGTGMVRVRFGSVQFSKTQIWVGLVPVWFESGLG